MTLKQNYKTLIIVNSNETIDPQLIASFRRYDKGLYF